MDAKIFDFNIDFFFIIYVSSSTEVSISGWIRRCQLDAADAGAFDGSNLDVSLIAPSSAPGVSDNVVLLTTFASIANSCDGVIELSSACAGVEDAALILLEDRFVGLDGDRDDTLVDGGLESRHAMRCDSPVARDSDLALGAIVVAASSRLGRS